MKSPRKSQKKTAVSRPKPPRAALNMTIALAAVLIIVLVSSRILLNQRGESLILGPLSPILIAIGLVSVALVWRGWVIHGTSLLAAIFFVGMAFTISRRSDIGLPLIISVTFLMAALIGYSWPRRILMPSMGVLTGLGIILLLADLFWPVPRQPAPPFLQPVFLIASGVMITAVVIMIFRQFPNYSIRAKLTITFLAVTLLSLASMVILNSRRTRTILIDNAGKTMLTAASQTAVTVDDFLNNTQNNVRAEANIMGKAYDWAYYRRLPVEDRSSLGILGETKAVELLKTYRDKDPLNVASYALLDMEGKIMFVYPPGDYNLDESERSYFKSVVETGLPAISPVEFSKENNEAYLTFSALVYDDAGERFGVLRGQYKASVLQTLIARSTGLVGGQSFAVLFDENYLHLAHGGAPDALYKLTALPSVEKVASLQASGRIPNWSPEALSTNLPDLENNLSNALAEPLFTATDIATDNRTNQVSVSLMNEQPWLVAFFQPQDVFLAPVLEQTRRTIILVLIIAGAVAAIAIAVANIIARPIMQLESVAARVAQGDLTARAEIKSKDEIGALASTFNLMAGQLNDLISTLERRVADRTRALEISGEVSRRLSTILDPQELVTAVVEQVQQAFNYYHAHIYLLDEAGENLVMVGGTGEAGREMLASQHQIPVGKGLVGQAGKTNDVVLVPDVSQAAGWLPNPLLPDTKAEIAVPIASGEHIFGVLDVQHNVVDGLTAADASLLQSVANQAAVALQNGRLYAQTQQAVQREAAINEINQQILQTTNMQEAIQVAIRELGRATGAPHTSIRLSVPDKNGRVQHDAS